MCVQVLRLPDKNASFLLYKHTLACEIALGLYEYILPCEMCVYLYYCSPIMITLHHSSHITLCNMCNFCYYFTIVMRLHHSCIMTVTLPCEMSYFVSYYYLSHWNLLFCCRNIHVCQALIIRNCVNCCVLISVIVFTSFCDWGCW